MSWSTSPSQSICWPPGSRSISSISSTTVSSASVLPSPTTQCLSASTLSSALSALAGLISASFAHAFAIRSGSRLTTPIASARAAIVSRTSARSRSSTPGPLMITVERNCGTYSEARKTGFQPSASTCSEYTGSRIAAASMSTFFSAVRPSGKPPIERVSTLSTPTPERSSDSASSPWVTDPGLV